MPVYRTLIVFAVTLAALIFSADDHSDAARAAAGDRYLAHLSTDKPIYRAGEHVYLRGVILGANDRKPLPPDQQRGAQVQITGPKGEVVGSGYASVQESVAGFDWQVPDESPGGLYTATISFPSNGFPAAKREFEVRTYRAPRLKGEIVFIRQGFGPGDLVKASLHVERAEGGFPAGAKVHASAIVDGADAFSTDTSVQPNGNVNVEFKLPSQIDRGDGTLALSISDGGVVETISKTIPILVNSVDLAIYPEGGDLIAGLPGRVYIEARTPNQKPADVTGSIVDSHGSVVANIHTEHEGRGRTTFTPAENESYSLALSQPAGVTKHYPLPRIKSRGVMLAADQLLTNADDAVRLTLASTSPGRYQVSLSKHTIEIASLTRTLAANESTSIELTPPDWADGVLVATVKDKHGRALAERLIFRAPAKSLHVNVATDQSTYVPAGACSLTVTTTDDQGNPVPATVGITVTDDSVLQMIEKREQAPALPAMILLEDDVKELADADVYLNPSDPKAPAAIDLLLGTQGWRRFATRDEAKFLAEFGDTGRRALADLQPPVPVPVAADAAVGGGGFDAMTDRVPRGGMDRDINRSSNRAIFNAQKDLPKHIQVAGQRFTENRLLIAGESRKAREQVAGIVAGSPMQEFAAAPPVRIYAHDAQPNRTAGQRSDFTETVYWCAAIKTDQKTGTARVSFKLNDSVTRFKVTADAFDETGAIGHGSATVTSVQPFYVEPKLPLEVSCGDVVQLPIAAVNGTSDPLSQIKLSLSADPGIHVASIEPFSLAGSARSLRLAELKIGSQPLNASVHVHAWGDSYVDDVTRVLSVKPLGFPVEIAHGGTIAASSGVSHTIHIPDSVVPGSIAATISLYPTPLANMTEALKRLMQEPSGCFEQTSSTTYPLVMADQYFLTHSGIDPDLISQSNALLDKGYDRLKGFECKNKGYEWFGQDPGHECLSAFGLLEFTDMSQVRPVDPEMLKVTRQWLLARRDGKGEYSHERRSLHTWITDPGCANGYCTWALLECGEKNTDAEVKWMKQRSASDDNSYVAALAANILHLAGDTESARAIMDRLAKLQDKDGHVLGAKTTVVGSGGEALEIETTSLATLAWLREPSYARNVQQAIQYLSESCKAGRFGSTQSTVLALRAIVAYDRSRAHPASAGKIQLLLDNQPIGDAIAFDRDTQGAIHLPDIADRLSPGRHEIALKMADGASLPYSVAVSYNSLTPASSDQCKLRIETSLKDSTIVEGNLSEARVVVSNISDDTLPSPIAIVGLPGGMEIRHDQLKELVKADRIAAYELRGREVVLYWREIQPRERIEIPLSVIAAIPGQYTAPASRAYLYYTDEFKQWSAGLSATITANAK